MEQTFPRASVGHCPAGGALGEGSPREHSPTGQAPGGRQLPGRAKSGVPLPITCGLLPVASGTSWGWALQGPRPEGGRLPGRPPPAVHEVAHRSPSRPGPGRRLSLLPVSRVCPWLAHTLCASLPVAHTSPSIASCSYNTVQFTRPSWCACATCRRRANRSRGGKAPAPWPCRLLPGLQQQVARPLGLARGQEVSGRVRTGQIMTPRQGPFHCVCALCVWVSACVCSQVCAVCVSVGVVRVCVCVSVSVIGVCVVHISVVWSGMLCVSLGVVRHVVCLCGVVRRVVCLCGVVGMCLEGQSVPDCRRGSVRRVIHSGVCLCWVAVSWMHTQPSTGSPGVRGPRLWPGPGSAGGGWPCGGQPWLRTAGGRGGALGHPAPDVRPLTLPLLQVAQHAHIARVVGAGEQSPEREGWQRVTRHRVGTSKGGWGA